MIAGILCGGYGKRLQPLTKDLPKSLLEIKKNYTILDKQLLRLKYVGIEKVYLLVGWLGEKIKERYQDEWNGIQIEYFFEKEPKGTLFAINNLLKAVNDDVVVLNGDIVTDINIKEMIKNHIKDEVTMLIVPLRSSYGIVQTFDNKIVSFQEKPFLPHYINGGIYIISQKAFSLFLKHKEGNFEELVFPGLSQMKLLNAYKEDGVFWASIDSLKDLEEVLKEYENKIDKPWGYEKVIIASEKYLVKELYIMKGERTSYQYHNEKDETLHILKGKVMVRLEDKEIILNPNDKLRLKPKDKHQTIALENTWIFEYSTPHPDDVVRLEDPYQR